MPYHVNDFKAPEKIEAGRRRVGEGISRKHFYSGNSYLLPVLRMSNPRIDVLRKALVAYRMACEELKELFSDKCVCVFEADMFMYQFKCDCGLAGAIQKCSHYETLVDEGKMGCEPVYYEAYRKLFDTYAIMKNECKLLKEEEERPVYENAIKKFSRFTAKNGIVSFQVAKSGKCYEGMSLYVDRLTVSQLKVWGSALEVPNASKMRRAELEKILDPILCVLDNYTAEEEEEEEDEE